MTVLPMILPLNYVLVDDDAGPSDAQHPKTKRRVMLMVLRAGHAIKAAAAPLIVSEPPRK
ncbi:MAG: hypothetical protein ABIV25_06150 [Paracoccaceae bacterium]